MKLPEITVVSTASIDGKARGYKKKQRLSQIYPLPKKVLLEIHSMRAKADAIMVGANTLRLDNPFLTVRYLKSSKKPTRITISRKCNLNPNFNIFNSDAPSLVITTESHDKKIAGSLLEKGVQIISLPGESVDLKITLEILKQNGINKLLVEGGPTLLAELFNQNLIQKLVLITYPIILGESGFPLYLFSEKIKKMKIFKLIKIYSIENFVFRYYKIVTK